jgi:hypothetical protein
MKKWKSPKGQDSVSVAVPHLAAEDFNQSGIDVAPLTAMPYRNSGIDLAN